MWLLTVLALIAGGMVAASSYIVAKKPNAKEIIDKLVPYQGAIGVVLVIAGLRNTIHLNDAFGVFGLTPFWTLVFLASTVVELGLGFLLAYGLLTKYVLSGNTAAAEKSQQIQTKLAVYQGPLGLAAIALGVLFLLHSV